MKSAKLNDSTKISRPSETDDGGNIHELLVSASDAMRQADIAGDEIAVNSVAPFCAGYLSSQGAKSSISSTLSKR